MLFGLDHAQGAVFVTLWLVLILKSFESNT